MGGILDIYNLTPAYSPGIIENLIDNTCSGGEETLPEVLKIVKEIKNKVDALHEERLRKEYIKLTNEFDRRKTKWTK